MRRESDNGFVCAACGETVFGEECLCDSEPISETEWSDLDEEAMAWELNYYAGNYLAEDEK